MGEIIGYKIKIKNSAIFLNNYCFQTKWEIQFLSIELLSVALLGAGQRDFQEHHQKNIATIHVQNVAEST